MPPALLRHHRQAAAVDGDAVADADVVDVEPGSIDLEPQTVATRRGGRDTSHRLHDAGEHQASFE